MKAATYTGRGRIELADLEPSAPRRGEVRIAVAYTGICGTDLHILHGHMDARVTTPAVIGHEMSGRIESVGEGVTAWSPGDAVTVMPLVWDGTCPACRRGDEHVCQHLDFIGIDSPGALQGLWTVPENVLVRLPDDLDLAAAALIEPVAVAVHDVRRSELGPGDRAVVIGGGPIGVLIASVARHAGAEVLLAEVDAKRRRAVEALGIPTIDPSTEDQVARVDAWTDGAGADVVFEVSGSAAAVLGATSLVRVRGVLVVVAIHAEPRPMDLQRLFWRELTVKGARVYRREDFEAAVRLVADGAIPTSALISRIVPLDDTAEAFRALAAGEAMKVLVDVGGAA